MESFRQDVRLGIRLLLKQRGFSTLAILTLALGIGLSTALFSVLDAAFIRPLPFPNPDQLVETLIVESRANGRESRYAPSAEDMRDWQAHGGVFSHVAASRNAVGDPLILDGDEPQRLTAIRVSRDYFGMYGVAPALGREFSESEYASNAGDVVILSHALWTSRFAGDSAVVGQAIRLNAVPTVIVGVMPSWFFPETKLWRPFDFAGDLLRRGSGASVDARLRPGLSIADAEAALKALAARAATDRGGQPVKVELLSMYDEATRGNVRTARIIAYGVALVLLLACVNVAGLLLARGALRRPEVAVRSSLGAGRGRLIRQLLSESLVLSTVGAAIGVALAWLSLDLLVANIPMALPENARVELNMRALAFAAGAAVVTGLLFGLVPAVRVSRVNPGEALAGAGRRHGSALSRRGGRALIAIEVALALVLLAGAGVMLRSFSKLTGVALGFDPTPLIGMKISPAVPSASDSANFYPALLERLAAHPGVAAVGATTSAPLLGGSFSMGFARLPDGDDTQIQMRRFLGDYFTALGLPLLEGRIPAASEARRDIPLIVITDAARKLLFGQDRAVGGHIQMPSAKGWRPLEVAGVVGDVRHFGPRSEPVVALWQLFEADDHHGNELSFIVRPTESAGIAAGDVRQTALGFGRALVVRDVTPGSAWLGETVVTPRRRTVLLGLLGGFGLVLALVGVFGMTAYAVSRRTQEIGVRVAFGASPASVVRIMLRDAAMPVLIGVAAGLIGSWWATGMIKTFLFETDPRDLVTFGWVAALLAAAAIVAAWIPARRAARVDPIVALRAE